MSYAHSTIPHRCAYLKGTSIFYYLHKNRSSTATNPESLYIFFPYFFILPVENSQFRVCFRSTPRLFLWIVSFWEILLLSICYCVLISCFTGDCLLTRLCVFDFQFWLLKLGDKSVFWIGCLNYSDNHQFSRKYSISVLFSFGTFIIACLNLVIVGDTFVLVYCKFSIDFVMIIHDFCCFRSRIMRYRFCLVSFSLVLVFRYFSALL